MDTGLLPSKTALIGLCSAADVQWDKFFKYQFDGIGSIKDRIVITYYICHVVWDQDP